MRAKVAALALAAASAAAWAAPALAKDLPRARPESVGMSGARLARIGALLDQSVARGEAPGYVTLVARRGKVVHLEAHGRRDPEKGDPMSPDTLFGLASMTKPITAVAALILYEEGRLGMHQPLSAHVPALAELKVRVGRRGTAPLDREITLHDLLTHTSGFDDGRGSVESYAHATLAEYMAEFLRKPLAFQPGTRWRYGDSYDFLGYLVQVVSEQPLDAFLEERIFAPLGMTETAFWPPPEDAGHIAVLLQDGAPDRQRASRQPPEAAERRSFVSGATGLFSTAADYWRFAQMLLNGGTLDGRRILGPRTVGWINMNHIGDLELPEWARPGFRFGFGVAVLVDPARHTAPAAPGSYGWGGLLGTDFWVDPTNELIGVIMMQVRPNPLGTRRRFESIVYSSLVD